MKIKKQAQTMPSQSRKQPVPRKEQKKEQPAKMMTCTFKWFITPDAKTVQLAGDFNNWTPIALEKKDDGFHAAIQLPPGEYRYKFIVDGEWHNDPTAVELVPNGFGTTDSVVRIG